MDSFQNLRDFYAEFVVTSGGSSDARLVAAFAAVPREHYLGKGPWRIKAGQRFVMLHDPKLLYQDVVVGLAPDRGINNGQPSLHARCLAVCAPARGECVVQIGAGTGYYTAILAELVGPGGKVIAYEIEADLAEQARQNLKHLPNVDVVCASAMEGALPSADVIYVCAGATCPFPSWVDALKPGGRLIFPLTGKLRTGAMLLVTQRGPESYAASVGSTVAFISCIGARDESAIEELDRVMKSGAIMTAKSLHRGTPPDETACCVGNGWWLSKADPV